MSRKKVERFRRLHSLTDTYSNVYNMQISANDTCMYALILRMYSCHGNTWCLVQCCMDNCLQVSSCYYNRSTVSCYRFMYKLEVYGCIIGLNVLVNQLLDYGISFW